MFAIHESFSKLSANGIEMALRFAQISLDSTERLVKLQLDLSKKSLEEHAKTARCLGGIADTQEARHHISKLGTQTVETLVEHSHNVYDILSQAQCELACLTKDNLGILNKSLLGSIDTLSKAAPGGTNVAFETLKSSFNATTAVIDALTRATQHAAEFANTAARTATDGAKNTPKRNQTPTS